MSGKASANVGSRLAVPIIAPAVINCLFAFAAEAVFQKLSIIKGLACIRGRRIQSYPQKLWINPAEKMHSGKFAIG